MPAYQSDYLELYVSVMEEVKEKKRIKVFERILHNFKTFTSKMKSIFEDYCDRFDRFLHPHKIRPIKMIETDDYYEYCCETPRKIHSKFEPTDERISLAERKYGKMIDKQFKKRYIAAMNYQSMESSRNIKKAMVDYIYEYEVKTSFLLRIADLLHLN